MNSPTTTIIAAGGSNPSETTITQEITVTVSDEKVTYGFTILSEISPGIYRVSGGKQATEVAVESLETTLAGTLLLAEYDGRRRRILTWLWQYGLRSHTSNTFRAEVNVPDLIQPGREFWMVGGSAFIKIHESVLEKKWSGRLYIAGCRRRHLILFKHLWNDLRGYLTHLFPRWTQD
ncbi:hypothetical protein EAF04_004072 [Stromatinia cepivora]|nr:hypothetical protein EAF04_004072 [Stromatinia cepivora]